MKIGMNSSSALTKRVPAKDEMMAFVDNANFTRGNLMRHVSVMSITSSIGLMAIFLVDLVDIIFVSMLGQEALAAAAGYASTIMFFGSAINVGLSISAGVLVSKAIGAGEADNARAYATGVAVLAVLVGLVVPLLALPNIGFLLGLIGASGPVADQAATYLWIILPTTMVSGLSMTAVAVLRAYGDSKAAMYPALAGAGVNAVADPILIFTLELGLPGAAFATVLARFVTLAVAGYSALYHYRSFIFPQLSRLYADVLSAARIAAPAVMGTVAVPIGIAITTREMAQFGADAVAGFAVVNRIMPVVFSVVMALSGAISPIFGQNYGAGEMGRVREAFFDALIFVAIYVALAALSLFVLREQIADLFGATGQARSLIYLFCGPLALAAFFNGVIFVANASFNNLGHPSYSTYINWARNTLGTWPFVIVGAYLGGAHGVMIGQAMGGVVFAAFAVWLGLRVIENPCEDLVLPHFRYDQQRMHIVCNRCLHR